MELLVDIRTSSLGLDTALEAAIVPIIGHVLDLQIVDAALRLKVESGKGKKLNYINKYKFTNEFNTFLY